MKKSRNFSNDNLYELRTLQRDEGVGPNLLVFGKSADRSSISAAQARKKKAVFYIDNINKDCCSDDLFHS